MFRLKDLASVIPGAIILGDPQTEWKDISIDSRTIKAGAIFFAIRGEKFDGHQFIVKACEEGASAIVLENSFYNNHQHLHQELAQPFLLVDNTIVALQLWSHFYHSLFKPLNICITGSNGKTTTKELTAHLLKNKYHVLKSHGNFNNEIGVPLTLLNLNKQHDVLVMEMAAQKTGEIRELTNIVKPDIAIITNIGEAHIGLFGNKENIVREKAEIILSLKDKGTAILNRDDHYFEYLKSCTSIHNDIISFGFHTDADLRAGDLEQEETGNMQCKLYYENQEYKLLLPFLGLFNIYNTLAALAVGIKMHIAIEEMIELLKEFNIPLMHMENRQMQNDITLVNDCYNANPTAVKEALKSIAHLPGEKNKIAILGDMLELGEQSSFYHQEIGKTVAELSFDLLFVYGDEASWIAKGAREQGMPAQKIYHFERNNIEGLVIKLKKVIPQNSIALIKGSRGMQMEQIFCLWEKCSIEKENC